MAFKVGDRIRGWRYINRQGTPIEGVIQDTTAFVSSCWWIKTADGACYWVFSDTAELLPPELPLPPVVDWSKPLQTRDGRPARLLAKDLKGDKPYVLAVLQADSRESIRSRGTTGRVDPFRENVADIVNVPPPKMKRKRMIAMSASGQVYCLDSWVNNTTKNGIKDGVYVAFKEIEIEEGEGM